MNIGQMTTYNIDSKANNFLHIETIEDLKKLKDINGEVIIFGGGSNILLVKEEYKNKTFIKYDLAGNWEKTGEDENHLYFDIYAGENISTLISKSLEYTNVFNSIYGLPGNIGGAIVGNTGSFGTHIGEFVESVKIYDFSIHKIITINKEEVKFSNKESTIIGDNNLIIKANIRIPKKYNFDTLHYVEYAKKRIETQPTGSSCGKYFFNPKVSNEKAEEILTNTKTYRENWDSIYSHKKNSMSVKWLIKESGLAGYKKDGVQISTLNSNFLINIGTKKGQDIYNMGNYIKGIIKDKFGIELKEKVRIIL